MGYGWRISEAPVLLQASAVVGVAAAELPVKAPPPVAVVPLWTGFYVGGNVGGGWSQKTFTDNFIPPFGAIDATPHPTGWVGGLQAGYNYQVNSTLFGFEGDFT